jgi:hypothetical protein
MVSHQEEYEHKMKKMRIAVSSLVGVGLLLGMVSLVGCSQDASAPTPNPDPNTKRDERQKALQPGLPGKSAPKRDKG